MIKLNFKSKMQNKFYLIFNFHKIFLNNFYIFTTSFLSIPYLILRIYFYYNMIFHNKIII